MDRNKIVFCNIAWMKDYAGVTDDDKPRNGGKFVEVNGTACESLNFLIYNKYCYGYVKTTENGMKIERINAQAEENEYLDGVTVIWVASDGSGEKIIGWDENATVYRKQKEIIDDNLDRYESERDLLRYQFKAEYKDCYLIRPEKRTFLIDRAKKVGKGKGFGQSNVWYADSEYAKENIVPKVLEYLENIRATDTIELFNENIYNGKYLCDEDHVNRFTGMSVDMLLKEMENLEYSFAEYLAIVNIAVEKEYSFRTLKARGIILSESLYYDKAEEDFAKALELDENDLEILDSLWYVYLMKKDNKKVIELGEKILLLADVSYSDRLQYTMEDIINAYINEGYYSRARELIKEYSIKKYRNSKSIINEWENILNKSL